MNKSQLKIIEYLNDGKSRTIREVQDVCKLKYNNTRINLNILVEKNILKVGKSYGVFNTYSLNKPFGEVVE